MLNKKIEEVKRKYYVEKNIEEYLQKSSIKLTLPKQIIDFCNKNNIKIKGDSDIVFPSNDWYITLPSYVKGEFEVEYTTYLIISKLANVYSILNSFEIVNKDVNGMMPTLIGDSEQEYTRLQSQLISVIETTLKASGYERIGYTESSRKIEGIKFADDVALFGPDVTVDDILFRDVLDVTPD
ncbi:hypothetical protein EXW45_24690 [Bacillus wiedmannii]|uniref:hypothetical protein n=1 Tax=Bacillus cereus group TaxID=86661 RepID=UPI0011EFAD62|nr:MULTISPECIES: hypothetical protein [Bacillus cereus group]KAA0793482.1 hypothetical protein DN394_04980 [Bacillus sp. BB081]QWH74365.1 hypothetical protein EXW45_24690 [Bacillus wiedmannii]